LPLPSASFSRSTRNSLAAVAGNFQPASGETQVALVNQSKPGERLPAGRLAKRIVGGRGLEPDAAVAGSRE
jgi:hypothetical protein